MLKKELEEARKRQVEDKDSSVESQEDMFNLTQKWQIENAKMQKVSATRASFVLFKI